MPQTLFFISFLPLEISFLISSLMEVTKIIPLIKCKTQEFPLVPFRWGGILIFSSSINEVHVSLYTVTQRFPPQAS